MQNINYNEILASKNFIFENLIIALEKLGEEFNIIHLLVELYFTINKNSKAKVYLFKTISNQIILAGLNYKLKDINILAEDALQLKDLSDEEQNIVFKALLALSQNNKLDLSFLK